MNPKPRPLSVSPKYDILTLAVIKNFSVVFGGDVRRTEGAQIMAILQSGKSRLRQ
jgi:hypothetical protein